MRELTVSQVRSITLGALEVRQTPEGLQFLRFTDSQQQAFARCAPSLGVKCFAAAGIRLVFETDTTILALQFRKLQVASQRLFAFFDVYCDGSLLLHYGTEQVPPSWDGGWQVSLPEGTHRVEIYFPNLSSLYLSSLSLSDGASLRPVRPGSRILLHGDSISQGYDAHFPSLSYANRMARHYGAEVLNQAIGSACFDPAVVERLPGFEPDAILIAYGTNDWQMKDGQRFRVDAQAFFRQIAELYPEVPTYYLLPIWRADTETEELRAGDYLECRKLLTGWAEAQGFTVLDDYDMVPHDPAFFSDDYLHPTDEGFASYAQHLYRLLDEAQFPLQPR